MKITTTAGLVGFLLALSSVNLPKADATIVEHATSNNTESTVESRLGRIAKVIKEKENQTEGALEQNSDSVYTVGSFANGGRGGFANGGHGGFANRHGGGGFANRHGGGGFANHGYGGGGFANRYGGGGFANRGGGGGFANVR